MWYNRTAKRTMIAMLSGIIELRDSPYVIINVNGVGYKVLIAPDILSSATPGQTIKVYTYTYVREDILELYGFKTTSDLKLFEMLIGVSGIGPKTAIGVFSLGPTEKIVDAIRRADTNYFTGVPRLGKKNAQKLIIELKNKLGAENDLLLNEDAPSEENDLVGALRSFGFTPAEARRALDQVQGDAHTVEDKLKLALRFLGR